MPISSSAVRPSSAHRAAFTRTYWPSVLNSAIPSGIVVERLVERSRLLAVELAQQAEESAVEHPHADVERERHTVGAPALERHQRDERARA